MSGVWDWIDDHSVQLIASIFIALLVPLFARLLTGAGSRFVTRRVGDLTGSEAIEREQRLRTLWQLLRSVALLAMLVVAMLLVLGIWNVPLTPFVAVGSVVGLALGFGAQDVVRDVIAGFLIVAEDQYSVGDVVRVVDTAGEVEEIRLRVTVLRDLEGRVHYVPNGEIRVATNLTQQFSQVVVSVGVAYKESVDDVMEVLRQELDTLAGDPAWAAAILETPEILGVDELGDSSVQLKVALRVLPDARWTVRRELLRRIKNRFDADGIEIPFPQRKVWSANP